MPLKRSSEIKVGLFALIAMSAFLVSVIVLTSKSSLFRTSITVHTSFENIAGLIAGAEVRVSGVTVGLVKNISFSPKEGDPTVLIEITIDDRGMDRVTKDSKATIASLGLLGKKYIEILPGDITTGLVQNGDFLEGINPASMTEVLDKGGKIIDTIGETASHLEVLFASISGEREEKTDLSETISSIRRIVNQVETGNSVLHSLIYDGARSKIIADLAATTDNIQKIVGDVREGSGNLHEVIYGQQFKTLIDNLALTSDAMRQIMQDIRTQPGVIHGLVYDEEQLRILDNLNKAVASLARVSERIERGEGTIGGLLIDPTIYEDLKKLTGEVERNRVLKTYIRYVVKKSEEDQEQRTQPPTNQSTEPMPIPESTPTQE